MDKESKEYVEGYIKRQLTEKEIKSIKRHCKRYNVSTISAWYFNWEDFCSDWCDDIGYTRTEARDLLHGGKGEFKIIDGIGILRFNI